MLLRRPRYIFWRFVHDKLEQAWHWVYAHKLRPVAPEIILSKPNYYLIEEREPSPADKLAGVEKV
jgi:hypothetical protein